MKVYQQVQPMGTKGLEQVASRFAKVGKRNERENAGDVVSNRSRKVRCSCPCLHSSGEEFFGITKRVDFD